MGSLCLLPYSQSLPSPRPYLTLCNMLFFYGEELLAHSQTQAGGPPFVGCPRLITFIHYILRHPSHLDVDSSIRTLRSRYAVGTRAQ